MARISPDKSAAHALSKLRQAIRLAKEAEKALGMAMKARTSGTKGKTRPALAVAPEAQG